MLPFTVEALEASVAAGDVTKRPHPDAPYFIYNYSPEVAFEKKWNDVTLNCRGLILDEDYKIIARPWKKFFNLGEVELPIQLTDPVEIMDKADGSLGILYPTFHPDGLDVYWNISTRGSFTSEQAIRATKIYRAKYDHIDPLPGYTLLFEIIYPSNRIVLDYGDMEDLILLGAVENETGYYHGPHVARNLFTWRGRGWPKDGSPWPGPVVEVFDYPNISEAIGHMDRKNAEGYVIRSHNFLVKLKQPDYLDLHRLVTNCSPKTVWEQLKAGRSKTEIVSAFPDEFHSMVSKFIDPLIQKFVVRMDEIHKGYTQSLLDCGCDPVAGFRAHYAKSIKNHPDKRYFFLMLDSRPVKEVLWAELKPTADKE